MSTVFNVIDGPESERCLQREVARGKTIGTGGTGRDLRGTVRSRAALGTQSAVGCRIEGNVPEELCSGLSSCVADRYEWNRSQPVIPPELPKIMPQLLGHALGVDTGDPPRVLHFHQLAQIVYPCLPGRAVGHQ